MESLIVWHVDGPLLESFLLSEIMRAYQDTRILYHTYDCVNLTSFRSLVVRDLISSPRPPDFYGRPSALPLS
jgi:hypothetical protein